MNPGTVGPIDGRYRLEREVGAGGMGTVYRALDEVSGQPVALKLLRRVADSQRFTREAMALAALDADAVVRYVGHGLAPEGDAFLAMEWLDGCDLGAHIAKAPLGVAEAVALGRRLCEGLSAIHGAGLLHRDLKPANVMLVGGESARAKVVDLGLARRQQGASRFTRTGAILGTVGYMSPEQARGERALTASTDLFSLGCVLHECLTGLPAFEGAHVAAVLAKVLIGAPAPLRLLRPDVPDALAELIERLLDKDPSARATDAAQVGRQLATLCIDAPGRPAKVRHTVGTGEIRVVNALLIAPSTAWNENDATLIESEERERHSGMREIVAQYGGNATALVGGMFVVGFDEAGSAAERASRAALCSLALVQWEPHPRVALAVGRSDATGTLGDAFDRAAKLINEAEPGTIAIDEPTARLLGGRFVVAEADGGLRLRGRSRSGESRGGRVLGKALPFVGRRKELAFLRAAVEEVLEERAPQVVVVSAPAGAGKSRLSAELRAGIEAPAEVLRAATTPLSIESAGALARSLLLCALEAEHPGFEQIADHVRRLPNQASERTAEFLGELLGKPTSTPSSELLTARKDATVMANRVSHAVADWLRAEAQAHPLVLILEDTHWADAASLGYIDLALRSGPTVLVLALSRPEGLERLEETFSRLTPDTMELRPLSDPAAAKIARVALEDADDSIIDDIVRRAEGNPFFLEELVRAVAAGQDEIPDTVIALAEDRIGRLEPELRQALRAASVFGLRSWVAGVAHVAGLADVRAALEWMDRLVETELLTRRAGSRLVDQIEYSFAHALSRDAVYGMIPERERAGAHALAAHWLESAGEVDAATLAEHYTLAGDRDRALTWRVRATAQAVAAGSHVAVLRHLERAAPLRPDGQAKTELLVCEARSAMFAGAYRSAARASTEAMTRLPPRSDAWIGMVGCLAWASTQIGDRVGFMAAGLALGDPREIKGATADHAFAVGTFLVTNVMALGVESGRPYYESSQKIAARAEPTDLITSGWGRYCDAFLAWYEDSPRAPSGFLEATAILERSGDLMAYTLSLITSAFAELILGRYDDLRAVTRRAKQLGDEHGLWSAYPVTLCLQCYSEAHVDEAHAEALLSEAAAFGEDDQLVLAAVDGARAYRSLVQGDWHACRTLGSELESSPLLDARVMGTLAGAWSALEFGDARRAAKLAARAQSMAEAGCYPGYRTILDDLSLRLSVESGDRATAVGLARKSLARHVDRAAVLGEDERPLYWAHAPWVRRARARIDEVLAEA